MQDGNRSGQYQPGYEAYHQLFDRICDEPHQSCLIITGRDKPGGFALRQGKNLLLEALESLHARLLIETADTGLTLQPVIMEYVTERFIQAIEREVITDELTYSKPMLNRSPDSRLPARRSNSTDFAPLNRVTL